MVAELILSVGYKTMESRIRKDWQMCKTCGCSSGKKAKEKAKKK